MKFMHGKVLIRPPPSHLYVIDGDARLLPASELRSLKNNQSETRVYIRCMTLKGLGISIKMSISWTDEDRKTYTNELMERASL